ncbi:MAG: TonB family protein [Xanthomonadales bacterium]|nr:TonB family protein [Xanthomonadales bacterium]
MPVNANNKPSWTQDRFMVCLVFAAAIHALIVLGVSFGVSLKPVPRLADTLDVVLVKWRSEEDPDQADYLAQASQRGGGDSETKSRPSDPGSGELPAAQEALDSAQIMEQQPRPQIEEREIVAVDDPAGEAVRPTSIEQPEPLQTSASQLMRQSRNPASLRPEVNRQRQFKSRILRREFISANTRKYEYASYMNAWVAKVERVGNMNYPTELRQRKLHGDLVLTVGIHKDGSVESIDVMRSSGIAEIDQAAIRIVRLAAPYSALPDNIREQVDVLHITRTWRFETGMGVD